MAIAWKGSQVSSAVLGRSTCRFQGGVEPCQPNASPGIAQSSANYNVEVLNDV